MNGNLQHFGIVGGVFHHDIAGALQILETFHFGVQSLGISSEFAFEFSVCSLPRVFLIGALQNRKKKKNHCLNEMLELILKEKTVYLSGIAISWTSGKVNSFSLSRRKLNSKLLSGVSDGFAV